MLVGRSHELSSLVKACTVGAGGLSLVVGEAGSGKSRLLDEVATRAAGAGVRVLRGHAVPGGGAYRPLAEALARNADPSLATRESIAPFRSVLARLLPAWPTAPVGEPHLVDPIVVLGEALVELLRTITGDGRTLVVLDDLHWADADTLAVLEYLADALTSLRVRFLGAARSGERVDRGWSALHRHPRVDVYELDRLGDAQSRRLARLLLDGEWDAGALTYVTDSADGLPLLVEELCTGLVAVGALRRSEGRWRLLRRPATLVPAAFADLVAHRVDALDRIDADIIRVAALLGRDLPWDLVAMAAGTDASTAARALRAAVDAGLLVRGPTGDLKWRHALTQDAVLAILNGPEQALLAARAAEALDRPGLRGVRLGLVAELHARSGAPGRAAELLLCLAREYRSAGALASALSVLERAAALADEERRVPIAVERVHLLAISARTDEALAVSEPLLPTAAPAQRTALAISLARACVVADRFADARAYLDRAGNESDVRVLALSAHCAIGSGSVDEALRLADAVVAQAGPGGPPPEVMCEALEIAGRGRRRSDPRGSQEAFQRAARLAEQHGLTEWRIRALSELGVNDLFDTGDGKSLRRAEEIARGAGMLGTATMLDLQQTALCNGVAGPVASMRRAERCAEQAGRLGLAGLRAHALTFVARGRVFVGRTAEAGPLLDEAATLAATPVHVDCSRFLVRAHDAWLNGDPTAAATELDASVDILARAEGSNAAPLWGEWALLRTVLNPTDTRPRSRLNDSDVLVQALNRAALHYCDAVIAAESGRTEDAARALAMAENLLATRPFFRHWLRGYLLQHTVLGNPVPVLQEALGWLVGTDELRMANWCRDSLRTRGATIPRPDRDLSAVPPRLRGLGITGREFDVLRLVGGGLSNPEIAARLQLSRRTVETHVSSLLAKTGATRRGDLLRLLR